MKSIQDQRRLAWALFFSLIGLSVFYVFETAPSFEVCVLHAADAESHRQIENQQSAVLTIPLIFGNHVRCGVRVMAHYGEFITAAATVVLAIVTCSLWDATRGMRDFARVQMEDTRILQRAYIAVEPAGVEFYAEKDSFTSIFVLNSGNLPARKVKWDIKISVYSSSRHKDFDPGLLKALDSSVVLVPKASMRRYALVKLTKNETDRLNERKAALYVWGIVHYHDGFTDGRYTKFCHRYEFDGLADDQNSARFQAERARLHQYGNGTDEDDRQNV